MDPGTRTVGYGLIECRGSRFSVVEAGTLPVPGAATLPVRLSAAAAALRGVLGRHRVDAAAMEDVFVKKDPRAALAVGEGRGALLAVLGEAGIEVTSYPPGTVKRAVCGHGAADKSQVAGMVARILGLQAPPRPPDVSDALAVALTHALRRGRPAAPPAPEERPGAGARG
ncbi:MAG: crossover junction endodeoxyribonuclease RuvC [Planctomycetota bacterium]